MNLAQAIASTREMIDRAFEKETAPAILPLPDSATALVAVAMLSPSASTVLCIAPTLHALETLHQNLRTVLEPDDRADLLYFPPWDLLPSQDAKQDGTIVGQRFAVLQRLSDHSPSHPRCITATTIQAIMQRTLPPATLASHSVSLSVDSEHTPTDLTQHLQSAAYEFSASVSSKGDATMRGGILDLWPPTEPWPIRVEFFGDTIESIRSFDPATQRSIDRIDSVAILPAAEWPMLRSPESDVATLLDYLPTDARLLWLDHAALEEHRTSLADAVDQAGVSSCITAFPTNGTAARYELRMNAEMEEAELHPMLDFAPLGTSISPMPSGTFAPDLIEGRRATLINEMMERADGGFDVNVFFDTEGSCTHFREKLSNREAKHIPISVGTLSEGFISRTLNLMVLAEADIYGRRKTLSRRYSPTRHRGHEGVSGARISDFTDMEPGDIVVHGDHGIGRYLGQRDIYFNHQSQEVLAVEYADGAKLYVPMSQSHLLSRYVGVSRGTVRLHRLSGKRWSREKDAAEQSIRDLASELLDVQASRDLLRGHAFPADTAWQHDFEAAFPFHETPDQVRVIDAVKRDMQSERPMDRLVCGDAGYGKTEVAMRAAFKALTDKRQVAVLVPTTVLAQQHYRTFSERMAGYPFTIDVLSRFRTPAQRLRTIEAIRKGQLDIVIGTHALLQKGVSFHDLGLVIIDEEQRFGVAHKERLKQMRHLVDVLTMTATPIPRTLYMSMTGTRDMSLLQTPPQERVAIETIVARDSDEIIRKAITREIQREGQVFFLYNRVRTIERARRRLSQLLPHTRIEVAHGQMKASELARIMRSFSAGEFEVLLCTTIIESGMDIPRANTILIDRADRFGLADLYQLRGRVGRSRHKAYAYLLLPSHGFVDRDARERIGAIRTHSGLGAGFNLALRDLEIRGAGNILGAAQSGHISAIGFGLYCQLLKQSIARLKGDASTDWVATEIRLDFVRLSQSADAGEHPALIPYEYIPEENTRVGVYRRIAEAMDSATLKAIRVELEDRFGTIPPSAIRLLRVAGIRLAASKRGIQVVEARNGKVKLLRDGDYLTEGGRFPLLSPGDTEEQLDELLCIVMQH